MKELQQVRFRGYHVWVCEGPVGRENRGVLGGVRSMREEIGVYLQHEAVEG